MVGNQKHDDWIATHEDSDQIAVLTQSRSRIPSEPRLLMEQYDSDIFGPRP
jgi:hypothetical protein